jgi:hypothetical protein
MGIGPNGTQTINFQNTGTRRRPSRDWRSSAQMAIAVLLLTLGIMALDSKLTVVQVSSKPYGPQANINGTAAPSSPTQPEEFARINDSMQMTDAKLSLRKLTVNSDNLDLAPPVTDTEMGRASGVSPHDHFTTEDKSGQVYRDIDPRGRRFDAAILPEDRINALLEQNQWVNRYDIKKRDEFIETVRENAAKAGFELNINEDYQVTAIRRMPNSVRRSDQGMPAK